MKHVSAAIAAAVVACMLLPSLIFTDGSDAEEEGAALTGQTYLSGYIYEPKSTGNEPIDGASVTIKMVLSDGSKLYDTTTDEDGRFDVNVTSGFVNTAAFSISFSLSYYTVRSLPQSISTSADTDGYYALALPSSPVTVSDNTYYLLTDDMSQSSGSDMRVVLMASTTSTLSIKIIYGSDFISGAKVTISSNGENTTTKSDSDGIALFNNVSVGDYEYIVKADGFEDYKSAVTVKEDGTSVDVNLTERAHTHYLWGFDNAHVMMLGGLLVGIFMAVAAWALHRSGKKLDS